MTTEDAKQLRDAYLAQLDEAIGDLPHRVAVDLRGGIAEELSVDDSHAVSERIEALGDPRAIAHAAAMEHGELTRMHLSIGQQANVSALEKRGYSIASAIVLGLGGFVVPVVGWLVGVGMVSYSKLWRTREKAWAIFMPFIAIVLAGLVGAVVALFTAESPRYAGELGAPNPVLPAAYDLGWSSLIFTWALVIPLSGVWLLLRLRGRGRAKEASAA